MHRSLLDTDTILSEIEQWNKLDTQWGQPVDLEDDHESFIKCELNNTTTMDRKVTFDSAVLLKKIHEKIVKNEKEASVISYEDFLKDLDPTVIVSKDIFQTQGKQPFYYVGGQIVSATSVNDICNRIDDIFKSLDKLSTLKSVQNKLTDVIECSISTTGLSFDETKENSVDQYIDELFNTLESTFDCLSTMDMDEQGQESVSTLVRKFATFYSNSVKKFSRRSREYSEKFNELTEFWKVKSCNL